MIFRRRSRDQRGAAAVEFALILPIFLLLLFGIIDFGYMINRGSVINNSARDAARVASLGGTKAEVESAAMVGIENLPGISVGVTCKLPSGSACGSYADATGGGTAIVQINYQHEMLTPVGMFFSGGFDLTRKAEMRIE